MQPLDELRELIMERLAALVDGYNREDAAAVVSLFAENGVFVDVDGTRHLGHDAIRRDHLDRFAQRPGSWFEIDQVVVDGSMAVATWQRHRASDGSGSHDVWWGVDVIEFDESGAIRSKSTFAKAAGPLIGRTDDHSLPG